MNSSMLAGERRWASARRGGMTVLGKVAVPKPLNLPSQRLENHGLDPNVEIVPKGTLSWGSRASSSGSNAWLSSAPNADGGNIGHSHVSGRPASGGNGTRPSTSESDRTNVPVANARGSNSRPSTASGSLTSNQTSLRPKTAETRPSSSQVSRFSEPVSESSTAWGASGVGERLGVKSYKEDGFSLSSGDFPTLGSEKENSVMNTKSQENCRPSSASERAAWAKEEDAKFHADGQHGTMNTLRTDGPRNAEDGIFPRMENWLGEPQQYFNTNITSQHFDAWHSPPFNGPAGPWYRGRPPGLAFGGHVAPGGFPMEPFPYYPPQISHPAVGGAQSVTPAGSGPRGTHPRNGDLFRPPMPDAYARPGIPFRPGFYRGPPVPPGQMTFEGYYGPPRGYCSNQREIPLMTARPPSYSGFQALGGHDPTFPGGSIGHGPSGKTLPVQMEADHQSRQRVPSKNHNDWYRKDEEETWDQDIRPNVLYSGKGSLPTVTSQNNEWGAEEDVENDKYAKRTVPSDYSARNYEHQGHSSGSVRVRPIESMGSTKLVNVNLTNELPNVASFPTEGCQIPHANERNPSLQGETKDSVLMQKLEVLNAKFRVSSDGQSDAPNAFNREERRSRFQVEKKMNNCSVEVTNAAGSFERVPASVDFGSTLHQVTVAKQSTPAVSRSSYHGGHGRVNRVRHPNDAGKTAEVSMIDSVRKIEGEPAEETSDPSDNQEQRARRRELAKQRVLQLHKEEEERTREQMTKAFAKLEELNRRTQVGETANNKVETTECSGDIYAEQEKLCTLGGTVLVDPKFQAPYQNVVSDSNVTIPESSISQSGESVEVTKKLPVESPQQLEPNLSHGQSLNMKEPCNARKVGMQMNDGGISKHNRTGYKQKQNKSLVNSSHENSVANTACEALEDLVSIPTKFTSSEAASSEIQSGDESNVLNTSNTVAKPSIQPSRKINSSKNKHKLDEVPVFPVVSPVLLDGNPGKLSIKDVESKASWSNLDSSAVTVADLDIEANSSKAFSSLPNEGQRRIANQLKRQPFRRTLRSQQPNKFMDVHHGGDTVIWAPVRTQNKAESGIEVDKKSTREMDNATNSDNMAQSNSKGKRAEMERYVPKPVAMELAQQGNTSHMPSSVNMLKSDGVSGILQFGSFSSVIPQPVGSVTVFVGSKVDTKEGDDKHKIHKKEHGTWRLRGSTDSSHMKGVSLGPALISELSKDVPKSTEHHFTNSVTNSANADTSDSHSISDNATTNAMSKTPALKDHGPTVRGKRHLPWVSRRAGNNPDHGDIFCNETDGSGILSAPDEDHPDRTTVSKDNRSRGDQPVSHWKPKLNTKFANNLHGDKTTGMETVTMEMTGASKKVHASQQTVQVLPQNVEQSRNSYQPQPGQSFSESNVVEESIAGNQQELDKEKKPCSAKEPPFSLNQDPINSTESAPSASTDVKREHNISASSRRSGKQNSRSMRGHESRGDWSSGQENRPTHAHRFRESQRQNAHYEYQPVGLHKSTGPPDLDGPADGASNVHLINQEIKQEKGQNHHKR